MDEREKRRILIAKKLFEAWSSFDPDKPEKFFHPEGILVDHSAGHEYKGWPEIRAFFAPGCTDESRSDPEFENNGMFPTKYWVAEDGGVALQWKLTSVVRDESVYGPGTLNKRFSVMGVTLLEFNDNDLVVYEEDVWNSKGIARSLGLEP